MKEVTDAFGNWFAGLTDGEGCFLIGTRNYKSPRANYICQFHIGLRDDDKPILSRIHDTLGIGIIQNFPVYPNDTPNAHPTTRFRICAINECTELVKMFEKYPLQSKKQRDFAIWKQAVAELRKPVDCRNPDLLEYYYLKIKEVRRYEEQDELSKPTIKKLQLTLEFE